MLYEVITNEVKEEFDFSLEAFLVAYPHHRYTEEVTDKLRKYWASKDIPLTVEIPEEPDSAMENQANPCRPCQNIRKKMLPTIFSYIKRPVSDVVIISGHSLWDIAAYSLNRQLAEQLAEIDENNETATEKRLLEISQRFYPFFVMPEGYSVFRPLLHMNQPEIPRFV